MDEWMDGWMDGWTVPFVIRAAVVRVDRFPTYFLFRFFFLACHALTMQINSGSAKIFYKNWWRKSLKLNLNDQSKFEKTVLPNHADWSIDEL